MNDHAMLRHLFGKEVVVKIDELYFRGLLLSASESFLYLKQVYLVNSTDDKPDKLLYPTPILISKSKLELIVEVTRD